MRDSERAGDSRLVLTVGSIFSGVGGIDVAFERAGCQIAWQVENDAACNRVLAQHWPDVRRYGDVTQVGTAELEPVDILVAGWPCQDNSVAGKRAGLAGERSGLFGEVIRLAAALRPTWLCLENVPGLLSVGGGRDMGAVLWALGQLGFWWAYRSLDSQWFGVAQRRERVFFVCHPGEPTYPVKVLFEPESCAGDPPPSRTTGTRAAASLTSGSASPGISRPGRRSEDDVNLVLTAGGSACYGKGTLCSGNGHLTGGVPFVAHTLRSEGSDASEDGTGRGTPLVPLYYSHDYNQDRIYSAEGCSPAVTAHDSNKSRNVMQGAGVRRLTPTECLRLQGLPDDWLDLTPPLSDAVKYRMVGNSVAVPCVEWIARRLVVVAGAGG